MRKIGEDGGSIAARTRKSKTSVHFLLMKNTVFDTSSTRDRVGCAPTGFPASMTKT